MRAMKTILLGTVLLLAGCAPQADARLKGCQDAFAMQLLQQGADEFTAGAVTGHFITTVQGLDELQSGMIRVTRGGNPDDAVDRQLLCMVIHGTTDHYTVNLKKTD